ncbi:MAG: heavy metal-binding domain-containing protein [Acidimicrobiales bacterium]
MRVPPGGPTLADAALDALESGSRGRRARKGEVFTSDLTVDEAVLLSEVGYEARSLVMGSSIYHVGYTFTAGGPTAELEMLSAAMRSAREEALSRLGADARRAGAEGVVGVRLEIAGFESARHLLEFTAIGTAVAPAGSGRAGRAGRFFTSALSGQEFYLLKRAGWTPLGLVLGSCVMQIGWRAARRAMGGGNRELPDHTAALYDARERAMTRLQDEATALGATGVVGMRVEEHAHIWGARALELFALGTAVALEGQEHRRLDARPVVPLDDEVVATDPAALRGG